MNIPPTHIPEDPVLTIELLECRIEELEAENTQLREALHEIHCDVTEWAKEGERAWQYALTARKALRTRHDDEDKKS